MYPDVLPLTVIWDCDLTVEHSVFHRINAPSMEAQNEPLTLSDLNEIDIKCPKFYWDRFSDFEI